jgi:hypothetical protein
VDVKFLPPTYTSRRWCDESTGDIDEQNGEVLYAREVKRYRLWRAPDIPATGSYHRLSPELTTKTKHYAGA